MAKPKGHKKRQPKKAKVIAAPARRPLLKRVLMALPALLAAVVLVAVFAHTDAYRSVEKALLDFQARRTMPTTPSQVAIVEITDDDYYSLFGGRSPLDPAKLNQLISAIAKGQPCVIGVDISTYDPPFKAMEIPDWWPPVIWVRDVVEDSLGVSEKPVMREVLGGKGSEFNERSGMASLIEDQGVVRRYRRLIETRQGQLPSFPWAVYQQSKNSCRDIATANLKASTDQLTINYSRGREGIGRTRIPASHVVELANHTEALEKELKGKIVLLGGSYGGKDLHETPLGRMPGVVNMANTIETELRGGGWPQPPMVLMIFLIVFEGIGVVILFDEKRPLKNALLMSVPMIVVVALLCSLVTYGSLADFPYFALIMVGVLIYEVLDRFKGYFKKLIKGVWGNGKLA